MRQPIPVLFCLAVAALAAPPHRRALAQDYPTRPIKLVVPFGPGGAADLASRLIAQQLTQALGQNVLIQNEPGVGNIAGDADVAQAPKDGYTLLLLTNAGATSPLMYKKVPYQLSDFAPIALTSVQPYVFAVSNSVPAKTLKDFIAYAKANPGKLNYGSGGVGAGNHLIAAKFLRDTGLDLAEISFAGSAPAEQSLMADEIQFYLDIPVTALPLYRAGRIRILATTSPQRLPQAPDIPSSAESGFPYSDVLAWYGIVAGQGTPKPIIDRLNQEIVKAVSSPQYVKVMSQGGFEAKSSTPAEFQKLIQATTDYYGPVIKELGVQLDSP